MLCEGLSLLAYDIAGDVTKSRRQDHTIARPAIDVCQRWTITAYGQVRAALVVVRRLVSDTLPSKLCFSHHLSAFRALSFVLSRCDDMARVLPLPALYCLVGEQTVA